MKEETLKAIEREKQNIIKGFYPLMEKELKERTLKILEEAKQRVILNEGYMVLLNDSVIFKGGNIEIIAQHLGKIIKDYNTFQYETGDRFNFIFKEVKGGIN